MPKTSRAGPFHLHSVPTGLQGACSQVTWTDPNPVAVKQQERPDLRVSHSVSRSSHESSWKGLSGPLQYGLQPFEVHHVWTWFSRGCDRRHCGRIAVWQAAARSGPFVREQLQRISPWSERDSVDNPLRRFDSLQTSSSPVIGSTRFRRLRRTGRTAVPATPGCDPNRDALGFGRLNRLHGGDRHTRLGTGPARPSELGFFAEPGSRFSFASLDYDTSRAFSSAG